MSFPAKTGRQRPHQGIGPKGSPKRMRGLMAGAHVPARDHSGYDDAGGYQGSNARRNGKHTGSIPSSENRSANRAARGSPDSHLGTAGRGGRGATTRVHTNALPESPGHAWFEKLGAK